MAFIELDELRRLSKSGIKFPNQVPVEITMFGHKCSVYGFLRKGEHNLLIISHEHADGFHNGWKIIKHRNALANRCYEIPYRSQVDLKSSSFPRGLFI